MLVSLLAPSFSSLVPDCSLLIVLDPFDVHLCQTGPQFQKICAVFGGEADMISELETSFPWAPIQDVGPRNESELFDFPDCLNSDELIWTGQGLIQIGGVQPGHSVLDKHGRSQRVYCKRAQQKPVWQLSTGSFRFGLRATEDQRCFVVRKSEVDQEIPFISYTEIHN